MALAKVGFRATVGGLWDKSSQQHVLNQLPSYSLVEVQGKWNLAIGDKEKGRNIQSPNIDGCVTSDGTFIPSEEMASLHLEIGVLPGEYDVNQVSSE